MIRANLIRALVVPRQDEVFHPDCLTTEGKAGAVENRWRALCRSSNDEARLWAVTDAGSQAQQAARIGAGRKGDLERLRWVCEACLAVGAAHGAEVVDCGDGDLHGGGRLGCGLSGFFRGRLCCFGSLGRGDGRSDCLLG